MFRALLDLRLPLINRLREDYSFPAGLSEMMSYRCYSNLEHIPCKSLESVTPSESLIMLMAGVCR